MKQQTYHDEFDYDLGRMKEAVDSDYVTVPTDLTFDQFMQWIKGAAEKIKEDEKKELIYSIVKRHIKG